ncbi:hypothetical protein L208DRAFT_1460198 [Tricholoma matsutake]|nr:hypothetical protein L208DRAFT_1460198 [Tricholoma matsutake 945]
MSRPALTASPSGPNFTIDVPPNWYAIVTAISRKSYLQGVKVSYDMIVEDYRIFGSTPGKTANQQMKLTSDRMSTSLPLTAEDDEYTLGFTFYYSTGAAMNNAEKLVANNAVSTKVHVVKTEKQPGAFDGPDTMTFFIFVEDTPSQEAGTGQFDDAVATVHFVQKVD